jgi:hypothetical protein
MDLSTLHPAFRIRPAGSGFVIHHWEHPAGAVGCLYRTDRRSWAVTLFGCEIEVPTTAALVRWLNTRV